MVMRKNNPFINLLLFISMLGILLLTAQEYVTCQNDFLYEFVDLAASCQKPDLALFCPEPKYACLLYLGGGIFYGMGSHLIS
jgi:hypothetical protein